MKRLQLFILLFCIAISLPLAFVIRHTYQSLTQEEHAQLRFFSEELLDGMEKEMAGLVQREENRAVDEYHYTLAQDTGEARKSPLAELPRENFILGYLQNNPDGSFQTPLVADLKKIPSRMRSIVTQLKEANAIFNGKKFAAASKPAAPENEIAQKKETAPAVKEEAAFAGRYLSKSQQPPPKIYLGQKSSRKEEITAGQALNLSNEGRTIPRTQAVPQKPMDTASAGAIEYDRGEPAPTEDSLADAHADREKTAAKSTETGNTDYAFQVEVAPFQSILISDGRFFIFRRIAIDNQIFRQGFLLAVEPFLRHLSVTHFDSQPMAAFTGLKLTVTGDNGSTEALTSGRWQARGDFVTRRTFAPPFDFISAYVQAESLPPSPARRTLNAALVALGLFMLLGLAAIYQSARTVDLSERRAQFVSSVTHELKTPLTNIHMYIEMLAQGIAATPEKEQEYLQVLGSESDRLSRLINNVLDLAKLEKKQRRFNLREGRLDEILAEVRTIMRHKLEQEGFELRIERFDIPPFIFDRDVLLQIAINLIENCIKFGRTAPRKVITISAGTRAASAYISVSDTGPGIPRQALKKVFDDFYRVDEDQTRNAAGTGIGLALVKKFVTAMGGRVKAANNDGEGCTITIYLPLNPGMG